MSLMAGCWSDQLACHDQHCMCTVSAIMESSFDRCLHVIRLYMQMLLTGLLYNGTAQ